MKIAVIGAGTAGLTAARQLVARGHAVTVYDKSRGTGGRMSTRRVSPWIFDHGAQYFTAREPEFQRAVRKWLEQGVVLEWSGRLVELRAGGHRVRDDGDRRYVAP
ncbi:MAG: FAD-dependent oxidoreductase, partial [Planctomycetota bacterium]